MEPNPNRPITGQSAHSAPAGISRRHALKQTLAAPGLTALAFEPARAAGDTRTPDARRGSPRRYAMQKSINLWAFPYPQRMSLEEIGRASCRERV